MPRRVTGCACGVGVPLMCVSRRGRDGAGRARRGRSEAHGARTRTGRGEGATAHPDI